MPTDSSHKEAVSGRPGMDRRTFLSTVLLVGAVVTVPVAWMGKRTVRYVEAIRGRFYPGPVTRLDTSRMGRCAKWGG